MKFNDYYNDYLNNRIYKTTFISGNDSTVADFYKNCISKTQLDMKLIEKWHKMFIDYSKLDDAIFWIRKYEGGGTKGAWNNRRACLTKYRYKGKNRYYVAVSNFDIQDIFNMISLGIEPPTAQELLQMMKDFKYPFHYDVGKSCEENRYAAYPCVKSHIRQNGSLSTNGWYLAHIHAIFKDNHISKSINEKLFPKVEKGDWQYDNTINKYSRDLNIDLSDNEYDILKACFIRFVDPINYYIVPNSTCEINDIYAGKANKSIGEYPELSYYVYENSEIYKNKSVINEFEKNALVNYNKGYYKGNEIINIAYRKPSAKTSNPKKTRNNHRTNYKIININYVEVVYNYLLDSNYSYRELDCLLGKPANNHGTVSYNLTKDFKDKRGILSKVTIDSELVNATGLYKEWLIKIKEHYNL